MEIDNQDNQKTYKVILNNDIKQAINNIQRNKRII